MDRRLIVRLTVPTKGPNGEDMQGAHGSSGTAYPVGGEYLLTARHVVDRQDRDGRYKMIATWWDYRPESASRVKVAPCEIPDDSIVYLDDTEDGANLDAVLVRCPRPSGVPSGHDFLSDRLPRDGAEWRSEGFPAAAADFEQGREVIQFNGKVSGTTENRPTFWVWSEKVPNDPRTGWPGVSGMPVFVDGFIVGVVAKMTDEFQAKMLRVTPSWRIRQSSKLRKALGLPSAHDERQTGFLEALRALVAGDEPWQRELRSFVGRQLRLPPNRTPDAEAVVHYLQNADVPQLLVDLVRVRNNTTRGKSSEYHALVTASLAELAAMLLPLRTESHVVDAIDAHLRSRTDPLLPVPAWHRASVELLMAARDGREAQFVPMVGGRDVDRIEDATGRFAIHDPPESGIDATGECLADAIMNDLLDRFAPDPRNQRRQEDRQREADAEIADRSLYNDGTYYIAFASASPSGAVGIDPCRVVANRLNVFSNVVCLARSDDETIRSAERDRLRLFLRMLAAKS